MKKQNSQNKILGGGEPPRRRRGGAKEFYFGYFVLFFAAYFLLFTAIVNAQTVNDVDLTWTTNSKSPVFYRAKSLPTQNSIITISALPFIYRPGTKILINSRNLIYNWRINNKLDFEQSGKNKFSYILNVGSFFGNLHSIHLEVKTEDGTISLEKEIQIPIVKPQIWLYFSDSKTNQPFGIALKNLTARATNFNFRAEAYFFTTPAKNLKWLWFINNTEVTGGDEKPWLATLNLANNFYGPLSTQIRVTAKNPDDELESSESITNLEIK